MAEETKKTGITDFDDAFVSGRCEIVIKYKDKDVKFFATEIGHLQWQNLSVQARRNDQNVLALLVAETIEDENGNKFTYEEACRLKQEYSDIFLKETSELNNFGGAEKK